MATWKLERDVPVAGKYDVVVCGAGPAGFCAAVQAARLGASTALVEATAGPGGVITGGGNPDIALFYAHTQHIIAGIGWEFVNELARDGWARIPDFFADLPHSQLGVRVNWPMAAHYMDQYCARAGVDLFYHHPVAEVAWHESDRTETGAAGITVDGVVVGTKSGLQLVRGKVFVDATGDGDVAALAGLEYELGEKYTGEVQPGTLRFYPIGFDPSKIDEDEVKETWTAARERGELEPGDYWPEPRGNPAGLFRHLGNNFNHVHPINGADSRSRSDAEVRARESVARVSRWARAHVTGAEHFEPMALGAGVAVRESRRITGLEYVTEKDYFSARQWEDAVCHAFYPIDLHRGVRQGQEDQESLRIRYLQLSDGKIPTVPFGALVPRRSVNLLVAGRCLSSDRMANSAMRVKAPCMAMGQAVGAAATLALENEGRVRTVDVARLRKILVENDAIVPGE